MSRIFISYSSKDRSFVLRLAQDLKGAGHHVWLDAWEITGRKPYWNEIQDGIDACSHFIFVVSPDSIIPEGGASIELFHAAGIDLAQRPTIIPVVARDTPYRDFPILISPGRLQIHDFTKQPYNVAFGSVLRALDPNARRPAPPSMSSPTYPTGVPIPRQPAPQASASPLRGLILGGLIGLGVIFIGGIVLVTAVVLLNNAGASSTATRQAVTVTHVAGAPTITARFAATQTPKVITTVTVFPKQTIATVPPTTAPPTAVPTVVNTPVTPIVISPVVPKAVVDPAIWTFDNSNGGTLTLLDGAGKVVTSANVPGIDQAIGTWRALTTSPDGKYFLAVSYSSGSLSKYDFSPKPLWVNPSVPDGSRFSAVDIGSRGSVYALSTNGDTAGADVFQLDPRSGKIAKQTNGGGIDLVVDEAHNAIWTVGADIEKFSPDLKQTLKLDIIGWAAVSIDAAPDGSVWVAERSYPGNAKSGDRLLWISPDGKLLQSITLPVSPLCVRVNPRDGNVWVDGSGVISVFDSKGNPLKETKNLADSLSIDLADGTVWAAGRGALEHYSGTGDLLSNTAINNASQTFIAVWHSNG